MAIQQSFLFGTRPSFRRAALVLGACVVFVLGVCFAADRWSPTLVRANLPLDESPLEGVFLTQLTDDPGRVLYTTRRENSTWSRDMQSQAGNAFWVKRYGDPERPGIPQRILIQSRSQGAHLFVPLAALDLEQALAWPALEADPTLPRVRHQLVQMYLDRHFAGLYLELRFPPRKEAADGEPIDHDLVFVRGNEVRTTDFGLRPDGELYRADLVDGRQPAGDLRRNAALGDEFAFVMPSTSAPCTFLPIAFPMFDELELMWGAEIGTVLDDRWDAASLPAIQFQPPSPEMRTGLAVSGTLHLAARIEDEPERDHLRRELATFLDG